MPVAGASSVLVGQPQNLIPASVLELYAIRNVLRERKMRKKLKKVV